MIEISKYILEKLHLNKDTIISKLHWETDFEEIEKYIMDKVKEIEEVDLDDIFNYDITDDYGNKVETLYYEEDDFAYSYYEGFERYKLIDDLTDIFNGKEIQAIYDYLVENDKS